MKAHNTMPFGTALPLPAFVLRPITAAVIAAVHVYLAAGHLSRLIGGDAEWTHIWKGCGALAGAYVFIALASRGLANTKFSAGPCNELRKRLLRRREGNQMRPPVFDCPINHRSHKTGPY